MNILDAANVFGKQSFEELPFNEVDALVFAALAYINLEAASPKLEEGKEPIPLKELDITHPAPLFHGTYDEANNKSLIKRLKKSVRYQDVKVGYGLSRTDKQEVIQFAAYSFLLPDETLIISYRGTDMSFVGAKEDLLICYGTEIPSQKQAVSYIKEVLGYYPNNPLIILGHSKGGNLAAYSSLMIEEQDFLRVKKVYHFDGPDFRYPPKTYEDRKGRIVKYMTKNDIVGLFYNVTENPIIISSPSPVLGGHDPFSWVVNKKSMSLRHLKKRSKFSFQCERILQDWLSPLSDEDLQLAVDGLSRIFGKSETLFDLFFRWIPDLLRAKGSLKDYTPEQRKRFKEIFFGLYEAARDSFKEESKAIPEAPQI